MLIMISVALPIMIEPRQIARQRPDEQPHPLASLFGPRRWGQSLCRQGKGGEGRRALFPTDMTSPVPCHDRLLPATAGSPAKRI
ncbi:hypothetical protein [Stagnihabitans tardus]|uniref:Uncharacterized protein n=1 Tax=Stagnihabitans tardus TaxID=2699202 RepID=A0AAE4YBP2_9RHOB|nr:hypothetical protein [Stagnihabitans tardus]NBZ89638.1 hypothetical protein [Stagnihabitans tardus]